MDELTAIIEDLKKAREVNANHEAFFDRFCKFFAINGETHEERLAAAWLWINKRLKEKEQREQTGGCNGCK